MKSIHHPSSIIHLIPFVLALLPITVFAAPAASTPSQTPAPTFQEITPASRQAVTKGLAALAGLQASDGSFGAPQFTHNTAITALAGVAFMAGGNLPDRGRYGNVVKQALDFILNSASPSGLLVSDTSHGPMYGHGFATLFLGEIYGETNDPRIRPVLLKAVRLIVNSQNKQGGWRYFPVPADADISVTICQVMALRSARNAGIAVPKKTIDAAIKYVKACQNPGDGGFRYMLNGGGSAFPRSAAGVAALYYAGVYQGHALNSGLQYLLNVTPTVNPQGGAFFYYGNYYAAQAMFLAGGKYWDQWYPQARDQLISLQQSDGLWDSTFGKAYPTAMSLIVLQMPDRLLPIFQR